jgi:hypothetical protein
MHGTPEQRQRFAFARSIFGSMNIDMQTMLSLSSGMLEAQKKWADNLLVVAGLGGGAMDRLMKQSMLVTQQFGRLGLEFTTMRDAFSAELMPRILPVVTELVNTIEKHMPQIVAIMKAFAVVVGDIFKVLVTATEWVGYFMDKVQDLAAHITGLVGPLNALRGAIVVIGAVMMASPLGRFITMLYGLYLLVDDFLTWKKWGGAYALLPWDRLNNLLKPLGEFKSYLVDIAVILGTIAALWLPLRLGRMGFSLLGGTLGRLLGGGAGAVAAAGGIAGAAGGCVNLCGPGGVPGPGGAAGTTGMGSAAWTLLARGGAYAFLAWQAVQEMQRQIDAQNRGEQVVKPLDKFFSEGWGKKLEEGFQDWRAWARSLVGLPDDRVTGGDTTRPASGATRADRNLNPLNLTALAGQAHEAGGRFRTFGSWEEGVIAAVRQLQINSTQHGTVTLAQQIARWAPPSENDTAAYVRNVAKWAGVDPNKPLDTYDPVVMTRVVEAMARMEGAHLPAAAAERGVQMAMGGPAPVSVASAAIVGGQQPGMKGSATLNQTTTINVAGGPNAADVAHRVQLAQGRVNETLLRNSAAIVR